MAEEKGNTKTEQCLLGVSQGSYPPNYTRSLLWRQVEVVLAVLLDIRRTIPEPCVDGNQQGRTVGTNQAWRTQPQTVDHM